MKLLLLILLLPNITFAKDCSIEKAIKLLPTENKSRLLKINKAVNKISRQLKVNRCIVLSIIWTESTFKASQRSFKGARGLMQLMPSTAKAMRLKMNYQLNTMISSNLNHGLSHYEIENIILGTFYYKKLLKKFNDNYKKALVAYNSGSSYVYNNDITDHLYLAKVSRKLALLK